MNLLGGELEVESVQGRGATFFFTIPVQSALADSLVASVPSGVAAQPPVSLQANLHVLVAEDNPLNAKIMLRLLQKHGLEPVVVGNGREAVKAYVAAAADRPFDLLFMDVQMPEMDGFQATAAIRNLESESQKSLYIVALTAHTMAGDRERCLDAGMNDYMTKPLERSELNRILSRWSI